MLHRFKERVRSPEFNDSLYNEGEVYGLKSKFKDCQETNAKGGCESRGLGFSFLLNLDQKKKKEFVFGPGVPCFYEHESSDNGTFGGVDVSGRGSQPSPYAPQHMPPAFALPKNQDRSSWSYHRCDKDWPASVDFLNNAAELERLRQYYRQMLARYGITPEELKKR